MDADQLKRVLEAALLAATQPLTPAQMSALFADEEAVTHEDIARTLEQLARDCDTRGIELKEVASGFRFQIREEVHGWVTRLWTERPSKYSRALLETLALIGYRQPITRAEIEQIRGVAVSTSMVKTLEEREWVRVVGYRDVPGKPALFGTTKHFLDYFNLRSLDELPALAEIRDLEEFEPQLDLAPVSMRKTLELPPEDEESTQEAIPTEQDDHAADTDNVVAIGEYGHDGSRSAIAAADVAAIESDGHEPVSADNEESTANAEDGDFEPVDSDPAETFLTIAGDDDIATDPDMTDADSDISDPDFDDQIPNEEQVNDVNEFPNPASDDMSQIDKEPSNETTTSDDVPEHTA